MSPSARTGICIIDDDDAVRDSLQTVLAAADWPVEAFASARQFLERFDRWRTGCVIADLRMPEMGGLELQAHLAERCPEIPVIVMTGHGEVSTAVDAMKAGAVDFIEKPFDTKVLFARIGDAVDSARRARQQKRTTAPTG